MTQTYLNETGVPLSMAVYLATDHYDHIPDTLSATKLLKPIRQTILSQRVPAELNKIDVLNLQKSRMGTSIHDGIEKAWVGGHYKRAMRLLGYSENVIDRIVVNPEQLLRQYGYGDESLEGLTMHRGPLPDKPIPVFAEIRGFREHMGYKVSGKFDFCGDGRLEDVKSTGVFTWIYGNKTRDYQLQGSIYRWLHPKIIKEDTMAIQFVFTDWKEYDAKINKNYPQRSTETQEIPLLDLTETEDYITDRLTLLRDHANTHETLLPHCSDEELWRKPTVYKYYRDPKALAAGKRSTKNFDTSAEAYARLQKDGSKGVVKEVPGQVVACKYCSAFPICTQKDNYLADGSLTID